MSAMISEQQVHTPDGLDDALRFLSDHRGEGWRSLAGGTDAMMSLYRDHTGGNRWLNLSRLRPQLAGVRHDDGQLRIGALTTMAELRNSPWLDEVCPLIRQSAAAVGAAQIQNRATVGGNIVNGSPAGDTLPVWLALDAELELLSTRGCRRIRYDQFMTGYRRTVLAPDELLAAILISPRPAAESRMYFRKVAPRAAQGISKLVFAAIVDLIDGRLRNVRLAFGSLGPTTLRARTAEQRAEGEPPSLELGEQAAELLTRDLTPIDDHRSTADYRLRVAKNLVREFLAGDLGQQIC
jgi:CO/xanthine dehydrogenase FAD-binding subunit